MTGELVLVDGTWVGRVCGTRGRLLSINPEGEWATVHGVQATRCRVLDLRPIVVDDMALMFERHHGTVRATLRSPDGELRVQTLTLPHARGWRTTAMRKLREARGQEILLPHLMPSDVMPSARRVSGPAGASGRPLGRPCAASATGPAAFRLATGAQTMTVRPVGSVAL